MSAKIGLYRLGTAVKVIGALWMGLCLYGFLFGTGDAFSLIGLGAVPFAAMWAAGWIIQGFAK